MSKTSRNWILAFLRVTMTLANIAGCFIGIAAMLDYLNYHHRMTPESLIGLIGSVLCLLNVLLIWSPIREFSNYYSLKMRRQALEEQVKIDKIEKSPRT